MTPTDEVELGTDGKKLAGTAEPNPEKCGSRLTKPKSNWPTGMVRYCGNVKGMGTTHLGIGRCKFHLGSVKTHIRSAERVKVASTLKEISESLGVPTPLRDPYIELWDLAAKVLQWGGILESKMAELQSLAVTDISGVEHSREVIALWERAIDRSVDTLLKMSKLELRKKVIEIQQNHAEAVSDLMNSVVEDERMELTDDQTETFRFLMREKFPQVADRLVMKDIPIIPTLEIEGTEIDDP